MKYDYAAYFFLDNKNKTCRVEIPALSQIFEVQPKTFTKRQIIKAAEQELALHLCILEKTNADIPEESNLDYGLEGFDFGTYLSVDSESAAGRIKSIRKLDIT